MRAGHVATAQCRAAARPSNLLTIWKFFSAPAIAVASWINRQMVRRRSRLALLEMTDEQLKDIGLSRSDAYSTALTIIPKSDRQIF